MTGPDTSPSSTSSDGTTPEIGPKTLESILTDSMTAENVGAYQIVADKLAYLAEQDKGKKLLGTRPDKKLHAEKVSDTLDALAKHDSDGNWVLKEGAQDIIPNVNQENLQVVAHLLEQVRKLLKSKDGAALPIKDVQQAKQKSDYLSTTTQIEGFILNLSDPKQQAIALKIASTIKNKQGISQQSMVEQDKDLQALCEKAADAVEFNAIKGVIYNALPNTKKEGIDLNVYKKAIDSLAKKIDYAGNLSRLIAGYNEKQKAIAQQVLGTIKENLQDGDGVTLTVNAVPGLPEGKRVASQTIIESLRQQYQSDPEKLAVLDDIERTLPPEGIQSSGISKAVIQQTITAHMPMGTASVLEAADAADAAIVEETSPSPSQASKDPDEAKLDPLTTPVEPESVSGDGSIDMWRPDPSDFLAKCGLGKNKGAVGPAALAPEATPEQKAEQAAMWYYTSAASCFNDQGEVFEKDFNKFKEYANKVFVQQFGLTQDEAKQLFSWSRVSPPRVSESNKDTVELESEPENVDMGAVKANVRAQLMSIPGVVTRKTGPFGSTEDTDLMPRVVDARAIKTFMKPSGIRGAAFGYGTPGSLQGNKFTVAPGRGHAQEFLYGKGKGTGKTLVQAAIAMGLFNKTGSKVKFNLKGGPQELQNKFSAILDEIERYDLPLDKCKFTLPGNKRCDNIDQIKKALQNPNHPLAKASTSQRNKLLLRVQSMENKIKSRPQGTEAPNVNMANCTQAAILTRAIPEGMTARQQESFVQDLKKMDVTTQKQVITEAAKNIVAKGPSDVHKNQHLDGLLGVVATAKSDSSTARNLLGTTIGGSREALGTLAKKSFSYRERKSLPSLAEAIMEVSGGSPLAQRFAENAVNLQQRACIDNMDTSLSKTSFSTSFGFEKRYDVNDMLTSQQAAADYIKGIDRTIMTQKQEIEKLEGEQKTMDAGLTASTKLQKRIDTAYANLTSLHKDKATAVERINTACDPVTHLKQRRGLQGEDLAKLIKQTADENKKLLKNMPKELPKLRRQMAAIQAQIKDEGPAWIYDTPKVKALKAEKASVQQEINRYTDAPNNAQRLGYLNLALNLRLDGYTHDVGLDGKLSHTDLQAQRVLEELTQGGQTRLRPTDNEELQNTMYTFNQPNKVRVEELDKDNITITLMPALKYGEMNKDGKPRGIKFDKDGIPTSKVDLPIEKQPVTVTIPRTALNSKDDFIKSLDKTVQEAQKTAIQSVLTNSAAVFEAVQAMVPDADERFSSEATGAIPIFTDDELKKMDVIKEITDPQHAERVAKLDSLVQSMAKSDPRAAQSERFIDKVISPAHNFKVNPLGIKAVSKTTKDGALIAAAIENCAEQKTILEERIQASTTGKTLPGAPSPSNALSNDSSNNPKPNPTAI